MIELKEQWVKAIDSRDSRRTYIDKALEENDMTALLELIGKINKETNLNIQLVKDGKEAISGFKASYGMITGVSSFLALVADKNIKNYKEKLGYYGEMLVLEATSLGLGTCWIGGTYKKEECKKHININDDEELVCIIAVGYVDEELSIKEKLVERLNKKDIKLEDIIIANGNAIASWMKEGAVFAMKSPSALNKKPIAFKIEDNKIKAVITKSNHGYEEIDLGISMLHFALGAYTKEYKGDWKYEEDQYIFS